MQSKKNLKIEDQIIPSIVFEITERLENYGYQAFVVGGALRDSLLKVRPVDWDVATDAKPDEIRGLFPELTSFNLRHGTVSLVYRRKHYDVTTFRGYGGFSSSIEEDLGHRDFTFNAMAYDLGLRKLIDPFGGRDDMARKIVRTVRGPMERYCEDPLRMMRAVRFAVELGYSVDPEALAGIKTMTSAIRQVARERVREELLKILMAPRPSNGLNLMRKAGLLTEVLPELLEGYRMRQNHFHRYTIYRHIVETVDAVRRKPVLRLAALFHDIAKPRVRKKMGETWRFLGHASASAELAGEIMFGLRFSNELITRVKALIMHHMFSYDPIFSERALRRFIRRVGEENLDDLIELRRADDLAHGLGKNFEKQIALFKKGIDEIRKKSPPLAVSALVITGHDVMRILGLQPGPEVGKALDRLLEIVIEKPEYNQKIRLVELLEHMKANF